MDYFGFRKIHIEYLPTEERRAYAKKLREYAESFQNKLDDINNRSIKRITADDSGKDKAKRKKDAEQSQREMENYYKLLRKIMVRTRQEYNAQNDDSQATMRIQYSMAVDNTHELLDFFGLSNELKGTSYKQKAVIYKKAFETAMSLLRESNISEEKIKTALNKTMSKIGEIKERYSDITDDEELAKLIQDECAVEATTGIEGTSDYNKFRVHVENAIGLSAWNRMTQNAQIFLITGELLFDQWKIYGDDIDFAPVCMSVSKALEVEVTRRYFIGYLNYLKENNQELPLGLLTKDGNGYREKSEEEFMLGNFTGVTGYSVYLDTKSVKLVGRLIDENQMFLRYAKEELFKGKSEDVCVELIKKHAYNIKKVCIQYRNPSAHKQKVTKVSARECLDYMIDVKKIMGELLDDCSW